ncbi:hypothetical protein SCAZ3_06650 [Streptococcus canis FSL Z3-227]|uniref:Transposase n=1 Tax=Streptococcus canis FSL Z3-227 TaxID=482234 RepID=A0AAV3FSN6_STRCB|nr:hypothetical protein SCAZ3_06650 [Streptococcus canis FSL Z3-227]
MIKVKLAPERRQTLFLEGVNGNGLMIMMSTNS